MRATRSEQTPKEQVELLTQIKEYFPAGKQETALATLEFVYKVAYLRGQRDLLITQIEKQKTPEPDMSIWEATLCIGEERRREH